MCDNRNADLDKPQYNSTLRLLKKLDDMKLENNKVHMKLPEEELERIHEKASSKLNLRGQIYEGLVSVEPNEEDFLKYLEFKNRPKVKPQINPRSQTQKAPDLMEFYPDDLIKEYTEVEIEPMKQPKLTTIKASITLSNDPIEKYFKWN